MPATLGPGAIQSLHGDRLNREFFGLMSKPPFPFHLQDETKYKTIRSFH